MTNPGLARPPRRKDDNETARLSDLKARIDEALHAVDDALQEEAQAACSRLWSRATA